MTNHEQHAAQVTADMSIAEFLSCHPGAAGALASIAPAFAGLTDPVLRDRVGHATTLGAPPERWACNPENWWPGCVSAWDCRRTGRCSGACRSALRVRLLARPLARRRGRFGCPARADGHAIVGLGRRARPCDRRRRDSRSWRIAAGTRAGIGGGLLAPGEVLAVRAAFRPTPLIQRLQGEGHATHCRPSGDGRTELLITPG